MSTLCNSIWSYVPSAAQVAEYVPAVVSGALFEPSTFGQLVAFVGRNAATALVASSVVITGINVLRTKNIQAALAGFSVGFITASAVGQIFQQGQSSLQMNPTDVRPTTSAIKEKIMNLTDVRPATSRIEEKLWCEHFEDCASPRTPTPIGITFHGAKDYGWKTNEQIKSEWALMAHCKTMWNTHGCEKILCRKIDIHFR